MKLVKTKAKSRSGNHRLKVHFELINPAAGRVCLAGTFNGWQPDADEMARVGDGKWVKDLELPPGTYEYRLVVDGEWVQDPNADHSVVNPFGEKNSVLTVP